MMKMPLEGMLKKENLPILGGILYAFFIPFNQALAAILIVLWGFLTLIGAPRTRTRQPWLLLPIGLFAIYGVSLIFSYQGSIGILERKLSLVLFPVIFYLGFYAEPKRRLLLVSFIVGLVASGIICIGIALVRSLQMKEGAVVFDPAVLSGKGFFDSILYGGNYFFGRYFSFFHQTVYYALYLCFGISILLFKGDILQSQKGRWSLIGFFVFLVFLISNKGSFLSLAGAFSLYILINTKSLARKGSLIFLLILSSFALVKGNPRLNESFNKVVAGDFKLDKNARYGFSTRLLSWDAALNVIKQRPLLGYGVASAQEALDEEYERKGYKFPLKDHLNAHNQFLQFWIESGLAALILWVMVFVVLLLHSGKLSKPDRFFAYSFVLLLFVNSLFESVMNRFSGISFISFAVCFLLTNISLKQSH
jgi:O-antigen ligase